MPLDHLECLVELHLGYTVANARELVANSLRVHVPES
jgi:hypothetical protein